jgi:small ligand-binding sensory domain FIST
MPFAAALATVADTQQALAQVCAAALGRLQTSPDLAVLFYSPQHLRQARELAEQAQALLQPVCLLGCPGETIIGNDQEIEQGPALSLWLARWTRPVRPTPFHLYLEQTPEGLSLLGWPDELASADVRQAVLLLLADPYTFPIDVFLQRVNEDYPGLRVLGGMASGTDGVGECRMVFQGATADQGAVGVLLEGPLQVRAVVSQGCRPIGQHLVVTRAKDNVISEVGGKSPLAYLQQLWPQLDPHNQQLLQQGLHLGRVTNEYQDTFRRGDFLVRNIMGLTKDSGALIVNDRVRVGQTVQFHVRDAASADEDLHELLRADRAAHTHPPAAALLFSCNGRGTRLFAEPHHDARTLQAEAGNLPLAGFFARGELGPVGGQNFIHGFTASVLLFED